MFGFILMGKQAMEMKRGRDLGWPDESGPLSNAKRRSLELASHVMKKPAIPEERAKERWRGRREKMMKIGRREKTRSFPLGMFVTMK